MAIMLNLLLSADLLVVLLSCLVIVLVVADLAVSTPSGE